MAIFEMLYWWYAEGWRSFGRRCRGWLASVTDFFSMDSLVRTLFKPYRQISAGKAEGGSLDLKFHMWIDRLVSRLIGFVSRLVLLLAGVVIIVVGGVLCLVLLILWPVAPLLPVAGIVMSVMGVTI